MLVIDKKKDIAILFSMGAGLRQVRKIFMAEGMLIAGGGCLAGLIAGGTFCALQKKYGLISMEGASFIEAYPVVIKATDFRSEEHTSELQSLMRISYAVFCLKKK